MPDPNKVLEENITYAVGPDVIKGWASRQFLPPAILSEFTPFVSLWAVGDDYIKQGAANRSGDLGGIQSIKFQNISRLENRRISPEHQVTENDIVLSSIVANIKGSDSTDISDRPIQLIPLLSNVTQLVTKDFRGGVGLTQFSTTFNCQSPLLFKSEATIEILNPYDLQDETLTITRLLVPGAYYVAIAGWQCNDRSIDSNYVDIDGKKVDIILPPQFDKVPGEFFAYADPNDKSTLQMYLDIKDTHNGFIQCFVMRLQGMKFRIEGNKIIASLTFCNPSTFIADKITLINIQSQINSLLSGISLELTEAAKNSAKKKYIEAEYNIIPYKGSDSSPKTTLLAYRLSDVISAIQTAYNQESKTRVGLHKPSPELEKELDSHSELKDKFKTDFISSTLNIDMSSIIDKEFAKHLIAVIESKYIIQKEDLPKEVIEELKGSVNWKTNRINIRWYDKDFKQITENQASTIKTVGDIPVYCKTFRMYMQNFGNLPFRAALEQILEKIGKDLGLALVLIQSSTHTPSDPDSPQTPVYNDKKKSKAEQLRDKQSNEDKVSAEFKIILPDYDLKKYTLSIMDQIKQINGQGTIDGINKRSLSYDSHLKQMILEYGSYNSLISSIDLSCNAPISNMYTRFVTVVAGNYNIAAQIAPQRNMTTLSNTIDARNFSIMELEELKNIIMNFDRALQANSIGTIESKRHMYNSAKEAIDSLMKKGGDTKNKDTYGEVMKQLKDVLGKGPWSFTTRMFFSSMSATIHGTFGLYIMSVIYLYGILNTLSGLYGITSVTHDFRPEKFETKFGAFYIMSAGELDLLNDANKYLEENSKKTNTQTVS